MIEEDSGVSLKNSLLVTENSERQDVGTYERLRTHMTHSIWCEEFQSARIVKLKGSFFKNMGYVIKGELYLYLEEVQHLAEKQQVYMEVDGVELNKKAMYNLLLNTMPHACYLTYLKLKVYIFPKSINNYNVLLTFGCLYCLESFLYCPSSHHET